MRFDLVSLFPDFVAQLASHGVVGRARERGLLSVHGWNPRDYASGNYRRVDERREARVLRQCRRSLEREPLAIAPHRVRPRRDLRTARKPAPSGIHRLERPEARAADRLGGGVELRAAHLAVLRKRAS